jgi:Ca2+-binding RTX toxin-like protein
MATLFGSAINDILNGTTSFDVISGLTGDDVLRGGEEDDALSGGAGIDQMAGGPGDDLIFTDGSEFLDGGAGIDVAILTDSFAIEEVFTFTPGNFVGMEGIQDVPDANSTLTVDANILRTVNGDSFLVSMGDGQDELRVINDGTLSLEITSAGEIVIGDRVTVGLEGVESILILDANNNVTNAFAGSDLVGVGDSLGTSPFVGTGTTAADAADEVELEPDTRVSEDGDLTPVADAIATLLREPPVGLGATSVIDAGAETLADFLT